MNSKSYFTELLDTGINQDFHNELTNYSDGMEYLTYFSPPLLDKGNEGIVLISLPDKEML